MIRAGIGSQEFGDRDENTDRALTIIREWLICEGYNAMQKLEALLAFAYVHLNQRRKELLAVATHLKTHHTSSGTKIYKLLSKVVRSR